MQNTVNIRACYIVLITLIFSLPLLSFTLNVSAEQIDLPRVEVMPSEPSPYALKDWKKTGRDYVQFCLDETSRGEYLPLMK